MKIIFIVVALLFAIPLHGQSLKQSVISSGGGSTSGTAMSTSITLGEPATAILTDGSRVLSQGFQQTETSKPVTSIQENLALDNTEFQIYPNPVTQHLHFFPKLKDVTITINSIEGKNMMNQDHENLNRLDVSGLPAGFYIITVKTREENFVSKFVKK